jgi:hypothetical protein
MKQKPFQELMQKELTRKEFLGVVGFGLASIFGLSTILRMLGHKPGQVSQGYGSNTYGSKDA